MRATVEAIANIWAPLMLAMSRPSSRDFAAQSDSVTVLKSSRTWGDSAIGTPEIAAADHATTSASGPLSWVPSMLARMHVGEIYS